MITWERFLQMCDQAVENKVGLSRHDLADCVDPANYFDEGMKEGEALQAANEFADELLEEEGLELD